MSPKVTKVVKCGETALTTWETVIGVVQIEACAKGLHKMHVFQRSLLPVAGSEITGRDEAEHSQLANIPSYSNFIAKQAVAWLEAYFGNTNGTSELIKDPKRYPNICWDGIPMTPFETSVWKTALEEVKYGQTVSYSQLAAMIANPKAIRAVGTALKKNPVFLIIPCHRIVRSDGSSGNYSGGKMNDVKEYLIEHEKNGSSPESKSVC